MKKNIVPILLLPLLFIFANAKAQPSIINTIAGNGTSGFSGDGGLATAAKIGQALGSIYVDGFGNIYFPDADNHRIRKVDASGIISTFAGGGSSTADGIQATSASIGFYGNGMVTSDAQGNIYIVDNHRVRRINISTGIITTVAGTTTAGYNGDGGPATAAQLNSPVGICFDTAGNLYIGDEDNYRIRKVTPSGIISTFAGTGIAGFSGDGGPATTAQMQSPDGLCIDAFGNMYVADRYNYRIRKIDPTGLISTFAGLGSGGSGDGGPATAARFSEPSDVCMDSYGNLYVADFHNSSVRKIDGAGIITTFAGGGSSQSNGIPATSASFNDVWAIGKDNYDNIYVADRNHYRICKINGVAGGTPTVSSDSFFLMINNTCAGLFFFSHTNTYSSGQHIKTYYGDGSFSDDPLAASGLYGTLSLAKSYAFPGIYSIKQILYNDLIAIDSISYSRYFSPCQNFKISYFFDANGDCVKDNAEPSFFQNIRTEVDSDGVAIDTIASTSGFNYLAYGSIGTIYEFRVLSTPSGIHVSCPISSTVIDTLMAGTQSEKNVGLACNTSTHFNFTLHAVTVVSGIHDQWGHVYINNSTCYAPNATVTMNCSPIYAFSNSNPVQTTASGNTATWDIGSLSANVNNPFSIMWGLAPTYPGSAAPGDTTHTKFSITPFIGDDDSTNNTDIKIDTVKAGCDPNAMWVSPADCIDNSVTQLQYTLHFENTGNDTAYNIYILDTLSDNVDIKSMQLIMSSHEMYTSRLADVAGHNVLKFDFPNINLQDSSHHGLCDGSVIFTVNSKPGLIYGTHIYNQAGIYFDYNGVVMTNPVNNVIGCDLTTISVNISDKDNDPVIYPNPARDILNLKADNKIFTCYTISNILGEILITDNLTNIQTNIDVKNLPNGIYYVALKSDANIIVKKFIKM